MKTTITILLTLTMFSVMGQTKKDSICCMPDGRYLVRANSNMGIMQSIFVPKIMIGISLQDKNGNYTLRLNHKQLHWLNDSTAIYITTPSKKRYVKGFNHSKLK